MVAMTDAEGFLKGVALGFSIAAPVGPIGLLCIRRAIAQGFSWGLASGLGAATADAVYGTVAVLGLAAVAGFLTDHQAQIRLVSGLVLLILAVTLWRSKERPAAAPEADKPAAKSLLAAYLSTLALTVFNPITILSFAAMFAALGWSSESSVWQGCLLVGGVFTGSTLWWVTLSGTAHMARGLVTGSRLRLLDKFSATIIAVFGLLALLGR